MSIVSVSPVPERDGSLTSGGNVGDAVNRTVKLAYTVTSNDPADGPLTAAGAVPYALGSVYLFGNDFAPELRCTSITPRAINRTTHRVEVEFTKPTENQNQSNSPLDEPPSIEMVFAHREKPLVKDIHGKPIRNTVGDEFDEYVMREDSQPVLRVSRNELDWRFGIELRDCVNRSPWMGAARRTVKFQPPSVRSAFHDGGEDAPSFTYYQKSYEFKFSDDTWRFILLNQGYRKLGPEDSEGVRKPVEIRGIKAPVALNEEGTEVIDIQDGDQPHYVEFDGYREVTFPNLGVFL